MRERLLDDLGALPDLRAGPRVTGVAEAEDVERRQRPVPVGFGVQDAFDGHVLVRQPGDGGCERAVRRGGCVVGHGWRKEPQLGLRRLSGPLGALDGQVDPQRRRGLADVLILRLVDAATEPAGGTAGEAHAWAQGRPSLPGRPDEVTERAVRGYDDTDQDERDERDRPADVPEGASRDLRDRGADETARALAARRLATLIVLGDREERDEHQCPTADRDDRGAPHETEPQLGRERG